jgi:hypothetical protein
MNPWKAALPALIIGPVTYLVCVAVLFWRATRTTPRPVAGTRKVVSEFHYLGEPEYPQPTHHALIDL